MNNIIKYRWQLLIIVPLVIAFVVHINNSYKFEYKNEYLPVKVPLTVPFLNEKDEIIGEALINSNQKSGCFTRDEVPKDTEYISYIYDGECHVDSIFKEEIFRIEKLLRQSYDSLYGSREYFDSEIIKLHKASKNLEFLWHPDQKKQSYSSVRKGVIEEVVINVGKYKLTITSPWYAFYMENDDTYTHIVITDNDKLIDTKDYPGLIFKQIYKIKVDQTFYYIIGLCTTAMRGCGILLPLINDNDKLIIGNEVEGVNNFSNYLDIENFFTINGELYTVLDDSRYFFNYSASNNASYNSAVPRIFKFDKKTGNATPITSDFIDLYKKSVQIISDDLVKLKDNIPERIRYIIPKISSDFLIPYFDYYLGMAIIAGPTHSIETRKRMEKIYSDFFGTQYLRGAHFDGYKDFEI
ncbi:MAG: hypothetical protein AAB922_02520 [Patescibacteria group bacterium]